MKNMILTLIILNTYSVLADCSRENLQDFSKPMTTYFLELYCPNDSSIYKMKRVHLTEVENTFCVNSVTQSLETLRSREARWEAIRIRQEEYTRTCRLKYPNNDQRCQYQQQQQHAQAREIGFDLNGSESGSSIYEALKSISQSFPQCIKISGWMRQKFDQQQRQ